MKKSELVRALHTNMKELRQGIDAHCGLVSTVLQGQLDERQLQRLLNMCPNRSRERTLEKAIKEAIDVLDESRKAFKSKRLEALRKRLTAVLVDAE